MLFKGFGPGATRFYDELETNNTRDWWQAQKAWYEEDVRAPFEHLLADLADEFGEAKMFRPNRDTRFSADKSPYKAQAAAVVGGHPDGMRLAVRYLALSASGLMVAGGCYMPAPADLARVRAAIADDRTGPELEAIVAGLRKAKATVGSREEVKTAPRGYAADHPRIDLLRMKGIIAHFDHAPAAWLQTAKARDKVAAGWRTMQPLNDWLDAV